MIINMKIMTKKVANSYKHKICRTQITKIKIMTIKKVNSTYNEERKNEDNDQHEDRDHKGCE
jgi:hypothetical protein